jgi:hypothetical protein
MKVNDNVVKDLAYQEMIYIKLLEQDSRFAALFPYTNISHDILQGGTRVREHPLPGIDMNTYEPSTLSVGGKKDDFHFKKGEIHTQLLTSTAWAQAPRAARRGSSSAC